MRRLLAKWNPIRDVWEVETQGLFSEHLDVFSETWPISGSMRNGEVFRPPTLERPIGDYASSSSRGTGFVFSTPDTVPEAPNANSNRVKQPGSLGEQVKTMFRTPCAAELDGGALTPEQARERGQTLRLAGQVEAEFGSLRTLPTPLATDGTKGGPNQRGSKGDLTLSSAAHQMLPTPDAYAGERGGTQHPDKRRAGGHSVALGDVVEHQMLPTPKAADGDFGLPRTTGRPAEKSTHLATRMHYTDFGDYAAAVQRWEAVLGRPAPAPTKPNPKTGKQQLSAEFVEWMMGLPGGWFTSPAIGLSRPQQFRIAGNGVVPQQGHAALAVMLDTALTEEETA